MASLTAAIPMLGGGGKGTKVLSEGTFSEFAGKLYEVFGILSNEEAKRDRISARLAKLAARQERLKRSTLDDDDEKKKHAKRWYKTHEKK